MPNKTVCFDSQIVIWGIKKFATQEQTGMIEKTENFIKHLDEQKADVIIPTIVLTEILSKELLERQIAIYNTIQEFFIIKGFDDQAALECAYLLRKNWDAINNLREETNVRKDKLKFDHAIIAIAKVSNASCIYSYDPDVKKFGQDIIEVSEIPSIPTQPSLF